MLGSVYVDTPDTVSTHLHTCTSHTLTLCLQIRTELLLELSLSAGRHTLLVGPHGNGKTTITRHYLQGRGEYVGVCVSV